MAEIREFEEKDWGAVWAILKPVFRAGETYAYATDISEQAARAVWVDAPQQTFVALAEGRLVGTYYLKPNQPSLGAHVCNCGYVVSEAARGRGLAAEMCKHSQEMAKQAGFLFMQYNLVAASNTGAVALWLREGFEVVGTLQNAFRHARLDLVDAHIMYKALT